jgi:molybdate transport system regulatory protein
MKHSFYISGNFEIEKGGQCFLNMRRYLLLKFINDKGSINAASKELKMSYQQAWNYIKVMNELSPLPIVIRKRGGTNGGGALLTKYGQKAIVEFEKLIEKHEAFKAELTKNIWLCFF